MDPFVGEIRLWALNFAPQGWAFCQGQLMPIAQNTALFSLLGTQFGGDGRVTFGLPNLQGMATVGLGQGTGLSPYAMGEQTGSTTVTVLLSEMPSHPHTVPAGSAGVLNTPPSATSFLAPPPGSRSSPGKAIYATATQYASGPLTMNAQQAGPAGGSQPHNNMAPYLVLNYCIALTGVFPQRQ